MAKIKVLSPHFVDGLGFVSEGTILEVTEAEARRKVQMGYAVPAPEILPVPEKPKRAQVGADAPRKE